jgi:preprotein translocase subunit SecG
LALLSTLFLKGGTSAAPEDSLLQKVNTNSSAPAAPAPAPNPATTADTTKK